MKSLKHDRDQLQMEINQYENNIKKLKKESAQIQKDNQYLEELNND